MSKENSMMRHTGVDFEQKENLLDGETHVHHYRSKYLCKTCLVIMLSGAIFCGGVYVGMLINVCDDGSN